MDTIFALASAPGRSGVAIVRISGSRAFEVASKICGEIPPPRRAAIRTLRTSASEVIDKALVLSFEEGHSFTGEPVVEFHVHGSPAIVALLQSELDDQIGVRHADPGEFTRRALENERLDLDQVEGLADLIEADTVAQHRQAMRVFSGKLSEKVEQWREDLVKAMALLVAVIDFADEDVPVDVSQDVERILSAVVTDMRHQAEGVIAAERVRSGFRVAILGPPNAGKSTLLNYLAGRDVAITSEIAGTTRDVIEVQMDIEGLPVTLIDTAGLRETFDKVEKIGVARAQKVAEEADLRIFLKADDKDSDGLPSSVHSDLVITSKDDLGQFNGISGVTGFGVEKLMREISSRLGEHVASVGVATLERHRSGIIAALEHIEMALGMVRSSWETHELQAEELRLAVLQVESLVGRVDVEQMLDDVFSRFCIGK
jgi:tRNA modification GTPase